MSPKTEEKILRKLDKIEGLIVKIVPRRERFGKEDVLEIVEEGDNELKEGKTKVLHSLKDLR